MVMKPRSFLQTIITTPPCRKSNANVVMMQAAGDGPCFDAPEGVNWSPRRRILVQGQVCSAPIVVARITAQQMEKVALSQDNHVIQTVPSDRTDRPFAITFCQGERAAVGRSRMPIARIRLIKASPYA